MRILIISDSHGNAPLALHACSMAEPFDLLFHLGDGADDVQYLQFAGISPCIAVAGNCDFGTSLPKELIWEGGGKKILLTHGDQYGVKSGLARLVARAKECAVDMVLYGHTHQAALQQIDDILVVNPGALHKTPRHSYAIAEISNGTVMITHYNLP